MNQFLTSDQPDSSKPVMCRAVSKIYRQGEIEVPALKNIDLTIPPGSFISICGPSGSGKSTLLNLLGGLDKPTRGEITVGGLRVDLMSRSQLAQLRLLHIGFIFQAYNLIPVLTALENVEFVMQLRGVPLAERRKKALDLLEAVGLAGLEKRRPGELSGGQQQRVAVARAIVDNPSLVLADEPTANLDSKTAQQLLDLMQQMNQEREITFVFSTHDEMVMDFARRLVVLHDGEIVDDQIRTVH